MHEDVKILALPFVHDVSQSVKYDIDNNICKNVYEWTQKQGQGYVNRKYDYGEILKVGLDDWKGIRIKFHFYDENTIRNISVNVYTEEYWIGEKLNESIWR